MKDKSTEDLQKELDQMNNELKRGIYKYVCNGEIIYIGKANSKRGIPGRIYDHSKEDKFEPYLDKCKIYYIPLPTSAEVDGCEPLLINKYKPILNSQFNYSNKPIIDVESQLPEWKDYSKALNCLEVLNSKINGQKIKAPDKSQLKQYPPVKLSDKSLRAEEIPDSGWNEKCFNAGLLTYIVIISYGTRILNEMLESKRTITIEADAEKIILDTLKQPCYIVNHKGKLEIDSKKISFMGKIDSAPEEGKISITPNYRYLTFETDYMDNVKYNDTVVMAHKLLANIWCMQDEILDVFFGHKDMEKREYFRKRLNKIFKSQEKYREFMDKAYKVLGKYKKHINPSSNPLLDYIGLGPQWQVSEREIMTRPYILNFLWAESE